MHVLERRKGERQTGEEEGPTGREKGVTLPVASSRESGVKRDLAALSLVAYVALSGLELTVSDSEGNAMFFWVNTTSVASKFTCHNRVTVAGEVIRRGVIASLSLWVFSRHLINSPFSYHFHLLS